MSKDYSTDQLKGKQVLCLSQGHIVLIAIQGSCVIHAMLHVSACSQPVQKHLQH